EPPQRALLDLERVGELSLRDEASADEHPAEEIAMASADVLRAHHRALVEGDVDLLAVVGAQMEHPALRLLSDELEYVGDAEILERSGQCHGQSPPRAQIQFEAATAATRGSENTTRSPAGRADKIGGCGPPFHPTSETTAIVTSKKRAAVIPSRRGRTVTGEARPTSRCRQRW